MVYEEIPLKGMSSSATSASVASTSGMVTNLSSKPSEYMSASPSASSCPNHHRSRSSQNLFSACHRSSGDENDSDEGQDSDSDSEHDINNNSRSLNHDLESGRLNRRRRSSRSLSRRSSVASHLYSSLRRRSMLRLSPLSISLMSRSGEPLAQTNIEDYPVDVVGYDDDQNADANADDQAGEYDPNGDLNNNPLLADEDPREHRDHHNSTLKITPSIVRRLPTSMRRESKYFPGRIRKRVILKNGQVNLSPEHVDKRHQRFLQDMFTTMVDIRWRYNLAVFTMGFLLSWFGFAVVWWLIAFSHSDLEHHGDSTWTPCINNLNSFASAVLFSIETQHTIGYGSRYTTEECPEAIFVMCLQSITGVMIQCFMVGFVFAKLSRPQKRSQTLMFSRHALTSLRDGKLCLMFRVGDLRDRSHIIGATIRAQVIRKRITEEGEVMPYFHRDLDVRFDNTGNDLFLIWPAIIVHEIDQNSPFYLMNCEAMLKDKFEIIVILEGTIESTGQSIQARTSYLPSEILWGHRFEQLVRYKNDTGEYLVDYSKFNNTFPVDIPTHSSKDFAEDAAHRERLRKHEQYSAKETDLSSPALLANGVGGTCGTSSSAPLVFQYPSASKEITRPSGPPPPPPLLPVVPHPLLSESQRERIKFFAH